MKIRAIGYDVDGTMVNSEPLHVAAWQQTLQQWGRKLTDLPLDFQYTMAGRKPIAIATFMVEQLHIDVSPEKLLGTKRALFMDSVKSHLEPMPGAIDSIKRFSAGYMLGIGTALDRAYIDIVLDRLGVTDDFKTIVTGDEITHGKPDPETYLVLADRMGVVPSEMVIFEDATSGVMAAKAAGCFCVAIKNPSAGEIDTSQADRTVTSLDDVTDEMLQSLIT